MLDLKQLKIHAYIDADVFLYRIGFAAQDKIVWPGQEDQEPFILTEQPAIAKSQLVTFVMGILESIGAEHSFTMCVSDRENFRKTMDSTYKEQRATLKRPELYHELRDFMIQEFSCVKWPTLEGDDVSAILATRHFDNRNSDRIPVIVSEDKDLLQVPVINYNPRTAIVTEVTPVTGMRFHMYQTLVGDRVDNYPGCPGIGPVKADAVLDKAVTGDWDWENWWPAIVKTYEAKKLKEADALHQARLAHILTNHWYKQEDSSITLWEPERAFEIMKAQQQRLVDADNINKQNV